MRAFLGRDVPSPLAPETEPYVDELGQWARKEWPGKVASEGDPEMAWRLDVAYLLRPPRIETTRLPACFKATAVG